MRWKKTVTMVEAHCEGEVGRVVTGGAPGAAGQSMLEKMNWFNQPGPGDQLRRFLVFEPRGHAAMSTNVLFPPDAPGCDAGFVVLQPDRAHAMSGSNAVCVATVLLETGMVEMQEPETVVVLDAPAGIVQARAACRDGKCQSVALDMTPAFAEALDAAAEVPGVGEVRADIAFGGVYYALVDPRPLGLEIRPERARELTDLGGRILRAFRQKIKLNHPLHPALNHIAYAMFVDELENGEFIGATVLPPGRLDRSPCGTGNCARLAVRHARGQAAVGEEKTARSVIGGKFTVRFAGETEVGGRAAVLAQISGRGWIHGIHQVGVDPSDPHPLGYCLSDTWGGAMELLNRPD